MLVVPRKRELNMDDDLERMDRQALMAEGTDTPVHAIDGALWLRISAFAYNDLDNYVRLADARERRQAVFASLSIGHSS